MINDYVVTFPYGTLLVLGGIMGYAKKGSTASLAGGLTTGLLLLLAGFLSRQAYYRHKNNSYFALVLQLAVAALLSWVMGHRYWDTRKMMPAGVVCIISLVMTKFYIFMVATGGNPIPVKAD